MPEEQYKSSPGSTTFIHSSRKPWFCPDRLECEFDAEPSVVVLEEIHSHCDYSGVSIQQEDEMYTLYCGYDFHLLCMLDVLRVCEDSPECEERIKEIDREILRWKYGKIVMEL
ncbi:hypothetical protein AVEN_186165-1 [Araneus ventricosus]|uniref:Uncharacterized protein n=1 Tax=Araneus ventricosus TaxID=182803 RepID=A0A4Y2GDG3_ARAVE|nr:hypothetical protein AVEN_186165-1 [Araneus ventricosus]